MFCSRCGAQIDDDSLFCESCGWAIPAATVQEPRPAMPTAAPMVPYSQNVPAEKENKVFPIFAIIFIAAGIITTIGAYSEFQEWFSSNSFDKYERLLHACRGYLLLSLIATSVLSIGILFSIISFYRKPSKLFFGLSISACIIFAIWNLIFRFIIG